MRDETEAAHGGGRLQGDERSVVKSVRPPPVAAPPLSSCVWPGCVGARVAPDGMGTMRGGSEQQSVAAGRGSMFEVCGLTSFPSLVVLCQKA